MKTIGNTARKGWPLALLPTGVALEIAAGNLLSQVFPPSPPKPVTVTTFECLEGIDDKVDTYGLVRQEDGSQIAGKNMTLITQPDGRKAAVLQGNIHTRSNGAKSFEPSSYVTRTTVFDRRSQDVCDARMRQQQVYPGLRPR